MRNRLYYSFNQFLRDKFGCRVHKLSLNAGFTCPNLDGAKDTKGCVFCNNDAFSYFARENSTLLENQINESICYAKKRFKAEKFIAYFQSYTNTYAEPGFLEEKFRVIRNFPDIVGLAVSTRPDCIDKDKLDAIESFSKDYMVWIEYGLQTIHNKSLDFLNRHHSFEDLLLAIELTKGRDILIGVHVIIGIPGESNADIISTADKISSLPISGVKLHCFHVVRDTQAEKLYQQNRVKLLSQDEYVDIVVGFIERLPKTCVILRLVSDADRESLIGPLWMNKKQKVRQDIEDKLCRKGSCQGKLYSGDKTGDINL